MELLLTATQPKLKCMSILLKSNLKAGKAPNCHTCNELDGRSGVVLAIDKLSGRDTCSTSFQYSTLTLYEPMQDI